MRADLEREAGVRGMTGHGTSGYRIRPIDPTSGIELELVAGRMEHGENPKKGAQRELLEETGYRAKKFSIFLDLFPTPGFLEERMFLLLAEGLSAGEAKPEEDEKIIVASYTRTQLEEMMRTHKLRDATSIAGLLFYFSLLAKRSSAVKK